MKNIEEIREMKTRWRESEWKAKVKTCVEVKTRRKQDEGEGKGKDGEDRQARVTNQEYSDR